MNAAFTILVVLIIIAAVLLIAVVLLQNGKDGGLATNFTSANQTLVVRQTATILEKATWYLVAFILVLSIITVFVGRGGKASGNNVSINEIVGENTNEEMPIGNTATLDLENPEVNAEAAPEAN